MKLLVLAPLRIEALAVRSGLPGVKVRTVGMGPGSAARANADGYDAVGIAGLCGAVDPDLLAGDVVLASELRTADGSKECPGSTLLAEPLRRLGFRARTGPVFSAPRILGPAERAQLRESGVIAVDMESAWLAEATGDRPLAVLRIVVDTAGSRLASPRTLLAGLRGLWTLRHSSAAFVEWAEACSSTASRDGARLGPVEPRKAF
jgi:nucleoside phosphorylase